MLNLSLPDAGDLMDQADAARNKSSRGGDKGGNIIASLLDAVGIGRQVAKPPKTQDLGAGVGKAPAPKPQVQQDEKGNVVGVAPGKPKSDTLSQVEAATSVSPLSMTPISLSDQPITPWGQRYLDSLKPLLAVDPDAAARGLTVPIKTGSAPK